MLSTACCPMLPAAQFVILYLNIYIILCKNQAQTLLNSPHMDEPRHGMRMQKPAGMTARDFRS
ncbi:hypothetical protein CV_2269 [Chromobacterium violaceum ATCC 12472]|uniref:Uncharacterized protein n=1 Tax=Chromobacterium violaceum (strain ATCC 12472 / DSM 30191 / JCM 1249 / CCUG 213 / NBRC 12614 / NCIMB 9131 / NCTC 9757 / MK) TaxID=243365 RepID=Q7NVS3_CHRVO|nr:hypothetical protein CV_2269 [Chromobacterium violaceum ATCC 12472]